MKNKWLITLIIVLLASIALASLTGCTPDNIVEEEDVPIALDHLVLDGRNYVDYAEVCDYDTDKYSDLSEQGLFWHSLDTSNDTLTLREAPADSELGASYVDTSKPTIIFIHGMEAHGYTNRNSYNLADSILASKKPQIKEELDAEEFPDETLSIIYLWLKKGWNVGFFHWERFSSETPLTLVAVPQGNEERIWATDGKSGTRFIDSSGKARTDGTSYCVAEHFAAEYIRAMRLLDENMGKEEIRVVAHSMGGEVTIAGLFLLSELSHPEVNQLSRNKLPTRYSLLDTYFSMLIGLGDKTVNMTANGFTVSWSKKKLPLNGLKSTILESIKYMSGLGVVMDYYTYNGSSLKAGLQPKDVEFLLNYMTITDLNINWQDYYEPAGLGWVTMKGHVAMLFWYGSSIAAEDYCLDITNEDGPAAYAPSALMATEDLKGLRGNYYLIQGGKTTFTAGDDTFNQPGLEILYDGFTLS